MLLKKEGEGGRVKVSYEKLADLSEDVMFVQVREDVLWVQGTNHLPLYYDTLQLTPPDFEIMKDG